jgi:hypothetical protein
MWPLRGTWARERFEDKDNIVAQRTAHMPCLNERQHLAQGRLDLAAYGANLFAINGHYVEKRLCRLFGMF